jgi:hypothetical protein
MNRKQQLIAQLGALKDILNDAKAILEWYKLRAFETKRGPSLELFFHDDTLQQLMDKQAAFQTLWIKINILLQDKTANLNRDEHDQFRKELNKISLQFYYLGSDVRVY